MLGNSKQIAELQEKISQLEADLQAATTDKTTLQTELDQAKAKLTELQAVAKQAADAQQNFRELRAALVAANDGQDVDDEGTDAEAEDADARACRSLASKLTSKASVEKQVTARLAAAGVDPVKRDPAASTKDGQPKPKADAALPPRQRAAAAMTSDWGVFGKN